MDNPPTEMQKKKPDGDAIGAEPLLTSGQTRDRLPPYADRYYLTPADHVEMSVASDEEYTWIRNDRHWEEHEGSSRQVEFFQEHPGARIPLDRQKRPRTNRDLILACYPKAQKEEVERAAEVAMLAWLGEIESGDHARPRDTDGAPVDDVNYMKQKARRMHEANRRSGITGNTPTSGQRLEDVYRRLSDADIMAEEARYRAGGRRQSFDSDDWAAFLDGGKSPPGQGRERGKIHAMGDAGLGRRPLNISRPEGGLKTPGAGGTKRQA